MASAIIILLVACTPTPHDVKQSGQEAEIYPDYKDVTIPVNIAPLNFVVRGAEAIEVKAGNLTVRNRGGNVEFGMGEWRKLIEGSDTIEVEVTTLKDGQWTAYKRFHWFVVNDSVDSYLSYRLIEPGYSVWSRLQIKQRIKGICNALVILCTSLKFVQLFSCVIQINQYCHLLPLRPFVRHKCSYHKVENRSRPLLRPHLS